VDVAGAAVVVVTNVGAVGVARGVIVVAVVVANVVAGVTAKVGVPVSFDSAV
jgi:hypothetical protein